MCDPKHVLYLNPMHQITDPLSRQNRKNGLTIRCENCITYKWHPCIIDMTIDENSNQNSDVPFGRGRLKAVGFKKWATSRSVQVSCALIQTQNMYQNRYRASTLIREKMVSENNPFSPEDRCSYTSIGACTRDSP